VKAENDQESSSVHPNVEYTIANIGINSLISLFILTIAYPFDIAHTRMTVDMTKQGNTKTYSSVADCFRKANNETLISSITSETVKIKPLYKGFTLAIASTLPYAAISIPMYEFVNGQTQQY
jgi:hypothetical protein